MNHSMTNISNFKKTAIRWKGNSFQRLLQQAAFGMTNVSIIDALILNPPSIIDNDSMTATNFSFMSYTSNNSEVPVCHFHGACLCQNGTLLIHKYLESDSKVVQSCTTSNFQFINFSENPNSFHWYAYDLSGVDFPPSRHIPHFIDFFKVNLVALDILLAPSSDVNETRCTNRINNVSDCSFAAKKRDDLQLAHLVPNDVMYLKFSSWIPQLLSGLSKHWYIYSNDTLFSNNSKNFVCFRSIITSRNSYRTISMQTKKVSLESRKNEQSKTPERNRKVKLLGITNALKLSIVLVDRAKKSARTFGNLQEIVESILEIQNKCRVGWRKLVIDVKVVRFEDMTFLEQVRTVESADVIVAIHGAGCTNLIFAHPGTAVVEIFPFMYYATFQVLIEQFALEYSSMVAEPDSVFFYECIANNSARNPDILPIIVSWRKTLDLWEMKGKGKVLAHHPHQMQKTSAFKTRICLRSQRIVVDTSILTDILFDVITRKLKSENFDPVHCENRTNTGN